VTNEIERVRRIYDESAANYDRQISFCEPVLFEAAVQWVLENRVHTKEAKAQIRRLRVGAIELSGAPGGQGG
jgi:hypothetical protein